MNKELKVCGKPLKRLRPRYKFWLETEDGYVFGQGAFRLLQGVQEKGTLSGGAKALGMSYRYAWGIVEEVERRIGEPVLETYRRGRFGGGGARLTQTGRELLEAYLKFKKDFDQICVNWEEESKTRKEVKF